MNCVFNCFFVWLFFCVDFTRINLKWGITNKLKFNSMYINLLHVWWQGGGFYIKSGRVALTACTVTGNTAVSKLVEERWIVYLIVSLFDSFFCVDFTRINLKSGITNKLKFNFMYMYINLHRLDYIRIVGYAGCK